MNFPYTFAKGYYDPIGQYINISKYTREQFEVARKDGLNLKNLNMMSLYFHEFRHWIDHISTLWGQKYLIETYRRYDSILKNKEYQSYIISPFLIHKIVEKNHLFKIYKDTICKKNIDRWSFHISTKFIGDVPFFTMTFKDVLKQKICISPVTFMSLFETNAVYEEIQLYLTSSKSIRNKDVLHIEDVIKEREYFELAYNSNLIEYSIACHIPAGLLEVSHPFIAYGISSSIATLILNLPLKYIEEISNNKNLSKWNRKYHWSLVQNKDLGYIMWVLTKNYQEKRQSKKFSFDEFLEISELPKRHLLELEVIEEMNTHYFYLKNTNYFYDYFHQNINQGKIIFDKRGIDGKKISLLNFLLENKTLRPPLVFDKDKAWDDIGIKKLKQIKAIDMNFKQWIELVFHLKAKDEMLKEKFL